MDDNETHVPPSQQSAQGPVPKPGEPVHPTKGILAPPKAPAETEKNPDKEPYTVEPLRTAAKPHRKTS